MSAIYTHARGEGVIQWSRMLSFVAGLIWNCKSAFPLEDVLDFITEYCPRRYSPPTTNMDAKRAKLSSGYEAVMEAVTFLQGKAATKPLVGIICGSGLGGLADLVDEPTVVSYEDIPHFPVSTVAGHAGKLVFGTLGGCPVVVMKGRLHCYEGYEFSRVALPIRTMCLLGISYLFVTNAAGGLNDAYKVGDLMILEDHLNMPGFAARNPLVGPHDERFGARFVPMSKPYAKSLRTLCKGVMEDLKLSDCAHSGVYAMVGGPTYETPAEARFIKAAGADAVGMSTVPEVIVAVQHGVKCMAMSLITNMVVTKIDDDNEPNHEEVLAASKARQSDVQNLFVTLCGKVVSAHAANEL